MASRPSARMDQRSCPRSGQDRGSANGRDPSAEGAVATDRWSVDNNSGQDRGSAAGRDPSAEGAGSADCQSAALDLDVVLDSREEQPTDSRRYRAQGIRRVGTGYPPGTGRTGRAPGIGRVRAIPGRHRYPPGTGRTGRAPGIGRVRAVPGGRRVSTGYGPIPARFAALSVRLYPASTRGAGCPASGCTTR